MARAKAAKPPAARQAASGRGGIVAFGVVASAIVAAAVLAFWPQAATAPEPQRKRTPASLKPQPRPQAVGGEYVDAFALRALPTLRRFIFSHYADFASSQLTFRDLKEHLAEELGMPYEALKRDELSAVIEDEVDRITNSCQAGAMARDECIEVIMLSEVEYKASR